ncbi:AGE family epimerase/isomerase [Hyphococcus flavus]|uniref:AGE family epimerase/isomerase n=1 Tax=Hyphococcus flavus TaxID=1866326 RepID=A0AAE9ZDE5_9PROT|nr:AGE family epimerase/isomerase [Hyphococcus flavus]WDI30452.1 AGE family epimerase/isomerase [Hyphococcus flavus]
MTAFSEASNKFKRWFVDDALPLWLEQGYDNERGGFYEALNFDATPSAGRSRRVRVQTRQIHTFSQAGIRGWHNDAESLAAKGFEYFLEKACPDNGERGCVHLIDDDGEIIDDKRDLYDQAFLLLACASRWEAAKDERAIALADQALAFLDRELASPHGGWLESDRKELPRRQNPHMHLFEAFMALSRATGEDRFLNSAAKILNDCFPAFYDSDNGSIIEFFNDDLSGLKQNKIVEPGHIFEWVWLLSNWEELAGADFSHVRNNLYKHSAILGENPGFYGFVYDRIDIEDPNHQSNLRLWPQTEYIKASCVQGKWGDEKAKSRSSSLMNDLFASYLNVDICGLWIDEFDPKGAPLAQGVPASILYHLFEAVTETERFETMDNAQ